MGIFLSLGHTIPFFGIYCFLNFGKNANFADSICDYITISFRFVWRQLEFAFFGALTSVGALFIFERRKKNVLLKMRKRN